MPGQCVLSGVEVDALSVAAVVVPVEQHRSGGGEEHIGTLDGSGRTMVIFFRQHAAQGGNAGAQHVHGMSGRGKLLQDLIHIRRQAAQAGQLLFVASEFAGVGQLAAKQ
jgi:hypothetical protein